MAITTLLSGVWTIRIGGPNTHAKPSTALVASIRFPPILPTIQFLDIAPPLLLGLALLLLLLVLVLLRRHEAG